MLTGAVALCLSAGAASALSEIQKEELPPVTQGQPETPVTPGPTQPGLTLEPPPAEGGETAEPPPDGSLELPGAAGTDASEDGEGGAGLQRPDIEPGEPLPEIIYDLSRLPEPVSRMRGLMVEAAKTGNIEAMRPLVGSGEDMTQLSLGGLNGDPIQFLKEISGDTEGQEILAIMLEVLEAGYVHLDAGTPAETYVWPYFFAIPLDRLDARQRVELFRIVTAGDYEDMKTYGAYIFYRVGITPQGRWTFFVAGD